MKDEPKFIAPRCRVGRSRYNNVDGEGIWLHKPDESLLIEYEEPRNIARSIARRVIKPRKTRQIIVTK